jgi:hypothetical protein
MNNKDHIQKRILDIFIVLIFTILLVAIVKYFLSDELKGFYKNFIVYITFFFVSCLFIKYLNLKTLSGYFLIIVFSVALSLYIVEFFLNNVSGKAKTDIEIRSEAAKVLGLKFDKRSKFQFYNELKSKGEDVVPSIPPNDYFVNYKKFLDKKKPLAISGVSSKKTIFCNEGGEMITYISDRYGFRNKNSLWDDEKIQWVILGDSLVHGACVNDKDTISERIAFYSKESILNLGIQGHGPLMELSALKEYAKIKKPKNVIWFYYEGNDLDNIIYEMKNNNLNKYLLNDNYTQELSKKQNEMDVGHQKLIDKIYNDKKYDREAKQTNLKHDFLFKAKGILKLYKIREFVSYFLPRRYALVIKQYSSLDIFKSYKQAIMRASNLTKSWGGNFYFVYYPHASRYHDSKFLIYPLTQKKRLLSMVESLDIKIIDLQPVFDAEKDIKGLYPLRIFGHPNEKGYDKVGEHIVKKVLNLN